MTSTWDLRRIRSLKNTYIHVQGLYCQIKNIKKKKLDARGTEKFSFSSSTENGRFRRRRRRCCGDSLSTKHYFLLCRKNFFLNFIIHGKIFLFTYMWFIFLLEKKALLERCDFFFVRLKQDVLLFGFFIYLKMKLLLFFFSFI